MKDTLFLRFLAIFLITNSHLHNLYPNPLLATGGALGDSIFFCLSGFGLILSELKSPRTFFSWYSRRAARILPTYFLVVLIFGVLLGGAWRNMEWKEYLLELISPYSYPDKEYWFVTAIMLFYILYFPIMKLGKSNILLISIIAIFIPYFYFYYTYVDLSHWSLEKGNYFKWIFYFQNMLFGAYLALNSHFIKPSRKKDIFILIGLVLTYFTYKMLLVFGYFTKYQFVVHLVTLPIIFYTLRLARSEFVYEKLMTYKIISPIITLVGGLTLEIYMLQHFVYNNNYIKSLVFPINITMFWLVVILLAISIAKLDSVLRKALHLGQ